VIVLTSSQYLAYQSSNPSYEAKSKLGGYMHCGGHLYTAVIAEHRSQGDKIFLKAQYWHNVKRALLDLLSLTTELVHEVITDTPVSSLRIKPLGKPLIQDNINVEAHGGETEEDVNKPNHSPEEEEMKRFHHALGHVIDLVSKK
jgi:hypothetical protein